MTELLHTLKGADGASTLEQSAAPVRDAVDTVEISENAYGKLPRFYN